MSDVPLFEELPYENAEDFLKAFSPLEAMWRNTGGHWDQNGDGSQRNWIFRGQSSAKWDLSPRAKRPDELTYYAIGRKAAERPKSLAEQLQMEMDEVTRFIRRSIRAGLPIPDDSQWIRNADLSRLPYDGKEHLLVTGVNFPAPLLRSLFALAQHHGVPTRLLDWSESPLVAAYFACRSAAESDKVRRDRELEKFQQWRREEMDSHAEAPAPDPPSGARIAVWALRQLAFQYIESASRQHGFEPFLEVVEAPFASNLNLRAQRGVFTLVRFKTSRVETDFRLPPVDAVVAKYELSEHAVRGNGPWLRKLRVFRLSTATHFVSNPPSARRS